MDDRTQLTADKQKKLASARKKLKQFQQRKTPTSTAAGMMDENSLNAGEFVDYSPKLDGGVPHIDDMSTWPKYNLEVDGSPSKVDYSLNGSHREVLPNGDVPREMNGKQASSAHRRTDSGHNEVHASIDLDALDTESTVNAVSTEDRKGAPNRRSGDVEHAPPHSHLVEHCAPALPVYAPVVPDNTVVNHPEKSAQSSPPPFHKDKEKPATPVTASTEGLQQLSRKINGLISESKDYLNGDILLQSESSLHELEQRNRDLASSVEKLFQENEKLRIGNNELRQHNNQLTAQLQQERELFDDRLRREMGAVKEQLQVHIQTIGILVAEKSELQSAIAQVQKDADKRLHEVQELTGRLKASRTLVNELERDIASSTTSSQHFEKSKNDLSKEVERLRLDVYNAMRTLDETKRQNAELKEKLLVKTAECESYDQTVNSLKHMVDMKDVLIQQLSNQPNDVHAQALDMLQQERVELLNRLEQYNEAFHQLTAERDHITDQYQTYIDQLTVQVAQHHAQVSQLSEEKEQLESSLNEARELNESLSDQLSKRAASPAVENVNDSARVADLLARLESLTADYKTVSEAHDEQTSNNKQLTKLIEERDAKISELESETEMLREDTADRGQLLENIQNDRVALSRALTQNKELRSQLEELQSAFVKIQTENMELATEFSTVEHHSKQYSSRVQFLQLELDEKMSEIDNLNEKLDKAHSEIDNLSRCSLAVELSDASASEAGEDVDSMDNISEHMHRDEDILALENKYMEITKEKADLLDRNERLEHMVTQLEGETETIGEYITIYHHERALLNERERQKEYHLSQLAKEREELKSKLSELQSLIAQLIHERDGHRSDSGTVLERRRLERNKQKMEDDWPTTDSDSSDESAVEAVEVSGSGWTPPNAGEQRMPDQVTRRIMNLIDELGAQPSIVDNLIDTKFTPVRCCTGRLMVV